MTASRKLAHDKVFKFFHKKAFLKKKKNQKVIALNRYINVNKLVYERRLMSFFSMTKFLC